MFNLHCLTAGMTKISVSAVCAPFCAKRSAAEAYSFAGTPVQGCRLIFETSGLKGVYFTIS